MIQRREDGSVNFDRDWLDYKKGFGQLDGEMWLGNYGIDCVTNQGGAYTLHVDVEKWDDTHYWAEYNDFRIEVCAPELVICSGRVRKAPLPSDVGTLLELMFVRINVPTVAR